MAGLIGHARFMTFVLTILGWSDVANGKCPKKLVIYTSFSRLVLDCELVVLLCGNLRPNRLVRNSTKNNLKMFTTKNNLKMFTTKDCKHS